MQPMTRPADPAPSRLSYRLHRLWLTPLVRLLILVGLPMGLTAGAGYLVLTRTQVVENARAYAADLRRTVEQRPEFMVKLMAIDGGTAEVSEDIREILPIDFPLSSFDLDLEAIRDRIEELDAVASAAVRVRSGGILQIDLVERTAAVVWRGPQGLEVLDGEGHRVAALDRRADRADLPLILGEGADRAVAEALAIGKAAGPLAPRARGLVRIGERRWDLMLDSDQRIMLPEQGAADALRRVAALALKFDLFTRDVALVDMRIPDKMTVRLREGPAPTATLWSATQ